MKDLHHLIAPLCRPDGGHHPATVVVIGEVLWDVFEHGACIGGAPLNFSVHSMRLGDRTILLSAVGNDELGDRALRVLSETGLDVSHVQRSLRWRTGEASVTVDADGQPTFHIERPAAYDDLQLSASELQSLGEAHPSWLYFGTLFPSHAQARTVLDRLLRALPEARRFYDVNLRPGCDAPELVSALLREADVVKLNESEAAVLQKLFGLPVDLEPFCRATAERFELSAICVTLGADGCALLRDREFCRAGGIRVQVADTVGAGDAFAAALLHGLVREWPIGDVAHFANQVGALVASRTGAVPMWDIAELAMHPAGAQLGSERGETLRRSRS